MRILFQCYVLSLKMTILITLIYHLNFYAEINIDNPQLWSLIITLSEKLFRKLCFNFWVYNSEINYGFYENKFEILKNI